MYSVCTTLNLMKTNKEDTDNGKDMEIVCSLYIFLVDDWFWLLLENPRNQSKEG